MIEVGFEAGVVLEGGAELDEMCFVQGVDLAALTAYQMMMPLFARPLEQRVSRAEVGLADEAQVLRRRERPVDGRSIDVGVAAASLFEKLRGGDVPSCVSQAGEDNQALRRHLLSV